MKDKLTEFADNSLAEGWLGLVSAGSGFSVEQRVPGSQYTYKCSAGYHLSNKTNPDQTLRCEGTREVNMDQAQKCYRESRTSGVTNAARSWYNLRVGGCKSEH